MDPSSNELTSELDAFRKQWLSEVQSKRATAPATSAIQQGPPHTGSSAHATVPISSVIRARRESGSKVLAPAPAPAAQAGHDDDDHAQPPVFDELFGDAAARKGKEPEGTPEDTGDEGLVSALDHFEAAVMREAQGNLGDSLNLYRKAFRMDSRVDQTYRKKHFGAPASRPPQPTTSPTTTQASLARPAARVKPPTSQSIGDLISSFQGLVIVPAPPIILGTPAPPCPISDLPEEILCHIFRDVAILDVADFARLSRVCKRFAYVVATEERIWRRVCLGSEFGFAGMHYRFQTDVHWNALPPTFDEEEEDEGSEEKGEKTEAVITSVEESSPPALWLSPEEQAERIAHRKESITLSLLPTFYSSSWKQMWRNRPRIRFNGCYISTVNYIRSGISNANHITWNSPVHIVTYYRYLRFFRDGTTISMLHTSEPVDVVPYLTKEFVETHRGGAALHLPSSVMRNALRGRWRLVSGRGGDENPEGDLVVETEGVSDYIYRMDLSLRSAGKAARNNKVVWRGFYSYNKLTDDWAEFELKNDKAFFFSRVRSYGLGE
ncbi:F-box protein pof7 [Scedosporium apiospermum]|uniref:F-box protein pof7 n=1 Tax=Pseudallescheria apiosperma TaxID=563466 RepID=A0A084G4V8_PSEDA|nr:F-box protein pof7 [Scedosporium apiospermum]KEZ42370.1 F-box protein pof7 [Scedosporium apiospermum]